MLILLWLHTHSHAVSTSTMCCSCHTQYIHTHAELSHTRAGRHTRLMHAQCWQYNAQWVTQHADTDKHPQWLVFCDGIEGSLLAIGACTTHMVYIVKTIIARRTTLLVHVLTFSTIIDSWKIIIILHIHQVPTGAMKLLHSEISQNSKWYIDMIILCIYRKSASCNFASAALYSMSYIRTLWMQPTYPAFP